MLISTVDKVEYQIKKLKNKINDINLHPYGLNTCYWKALKSHLSKKYKFYCKITTLFGPGLKKSILDIIH